MSQNWDLEEFYEDFAGQMRRLDGQIAQLEVWCDTYTINHKKEETRLDDYAALSQNLYEQVEDLKAALAVWRENESDEAWAKEQEQLIAAKLEQYALTQTQILEWVRDIKNLQVILVNAMTLSENKAHIEYLLSL